MFLETNNNTINHPIGLFDDIPYDEPKNIAIEDDSYDAEELIKDIQNDDSFYNTEEPINNIQNDADASNNDPEQLQPEENVTKRRRKTSPKINAAANIDELYDKFKKRTNAKNADALISALYDSILATEPEFVTEMEERIIKRRSETAIRDTMALFFQNNMKHKTTLHYNSLSENDKIDMYGLVVDELMQNSGPYNGLPLELAIVKTLDMLMSNKEWKIRLGYLTPAKKPVESDDENDE